MDGQGSAAVRFSESYSLLIADSCRHTHFYDEFWRITVFCQFLESPPMFKGTLSWLVVMLKSITKLWPLSNYQAFVPLNHTLFENKGNQIIIIFVNFTVQRNY